MDDVRSRIERVHCCRTVVSMAELSAHMHYSGSALSNVTGINRPEFRIKCSHPTYTEMNI
jgi:hypothetical protein